MSALMLGAKLFDGFLQTQTVYYHELFLMVNLPWIHRFWPWTAEKMRSEIVQVDLVINWGELKEDFVCRHLRLTNRLGQEDFIAVSSMVPLLPNLKDPKKRGWWNYYIISLK